MHDRISVNNLCFPGSPLATDIERWRSLGARRIGIQTAKMNAEGWDSYVDVLRGSGFELETIVHLNPNRWDDDAQVERFKKELSRTLAAGNVLGARSVYVTSGARGTLTWEEAAEKFCSAIAPCAEEARRASIELLVEPAPALFAEFYFTHSLRDAVATGGAGRRRRGDRRLCFLDRGAAARVDRTGGEALSPRPGGRLRAR